MTPAAALVALACYAPPPAPLVDAPVLAALRGETIPPAPPRADVAAALSSLSARRSRR